MSPQTAGVATLAPPAAPAFSAVRVFSPEGVLLRVITHAELRARPQVVPICTPPFLPVRSELFVLPTVAAVARRQAGHAALRRRNRARRTPAGAVVVA